MRRLLAAVVVSVVVVLAVASTAGAANVGVLRCPTTYGISQPTRSLPPWVATKLPVAQVRGLALFGNNELLVLAPASWSCSGQIGADGSAGMMVTHGPQAVAVQAVPYTSGVGASEACALFSDANPPAPCLEHPPAAQQITRLSSTAVAFEDPPGVRGSGTDSGGSEPANGVMVFNPSRSSGYFFEETCVLPAAERALCTTLLNDALARAPR